MVKHNYEVRKTALFPYYKYKQDAYKKLKELAVKILDEYGYFERTGQSKALRGLYFGNDENGVLGAVYVYKPNGSCLFGIEGTVISSGLSLRNYLTPKEHDTVTKCLAALFKHKGDRTIVGYLESRIDYWEANEEYCEFVADEFRYLNKD